MDKEFFSNRIKNIVKNINNNSLIILHSGLEITKSEDIFYEFIVNRNFFYLTNIKQKNSFLVIFKISENEYYKYIFIDKIDDKRVKWFGKMLNENDIINNTYFIKEEIFTNDILDIKLRELIEKFKPKTLYLDFKNNNKTKELAENLNFSDKEIEDIYSKIIELRAIKDDFEIENLKRAIEITKIGIEKIKKIKNNVEYEYEIFNSFNHEILNHGSHEIGFDSIVASGKNSCYLHYPNPYSKIGNGDILLCDVGARYNNYSADITRTLVIGDKFTDLQSTIYNIVLECNKYIINNIKQGINLNHLQNLTIDFFINKCLKERLIEDKEDLVKNYYFHNVSHHLGIDTHDPVSREEELKPGNVITVEPGLYFEKYKIGVRIEDDILVTENGHINLSENIEK